MKPLARYHLVWAVQVAVVTASVFFYALASWLHQGRPPVWHFWAQQMIVVAGVYIVWARVKAFNKARKS